jgi:hypothetical protein
MSFWSFDFVTPHCRPNACKTKEQPPPQPKTTNKKQQQQQRKTATNKKQQQQQQQLTNLSPQETIMCVNEVVGNEPRLGRVAATSGIIPLVALMREQGTGLAELAAAALLSISRADPATALPLLHEASAHHVGLALLARGTDCPHDTLNLLLLMLRESSVVALELGRGRAVPQLGALLQQNHEDKELAALITETLSLIHAALVAKPLTAWSSQAASWAARDQAQALWHS